MLMRPGFCLRSLLPLLLAAGAAAQQPLGLAAAPSRDRNVVLDVVVTPKSGAPVAGLTQKDFMVLDNKANRTPTSFRAVSGKDAPIDVILVLDAVNTDYENVAFEREQMEKFLRRNDGHLDHPTSLAVVTDTGSQIQEAPSLDGIMLSKSLEQYTVGLRTIRRSSGFYGAGDRLQLSINAMTQLATRESSHPGRKVVLWVSPGWPLLSGPNTELDSKQQQEIFSSVVRLSDLLRKSRMTVYSIDPLGTADAGQFRTFFYKSFVKGLSKSSDAALGDLGLQVLAVQSGGLALTGSNDVAKLLEQCSADTEAYYEITFDEPPAERANEYHSIEVQVAGPGLTARTRQGYYAQP